MIKTLTHPVVGLTKCIWNMAN